MKILAHQLSSGKEDHPAIVHIETARKFPHLFGFILRNSHLLGSSSSAANRCSKLWTSIMFCANCLKFECELKICKFCKGDHQGSVPMCWFCSEECENKFLELGHALAHDEDVMQKLGL
jgi:hypothetical protein